jgi:hypothetical protein
MDARQDTGHASGGVYYPLMPSSSIPKDALYRTPRPATVHRSVFIEHRLFVNMYLRIVITSSILFLPSMST